MKKMSLTTFIFKKGIQDSKKQLLLFSLMLLFSPLPLAKLGAEPVKSHVTEVTDFSLAEKFSLNETSEDQQQRKTIQGKVTDKEGEPIIGANVIVKGTQSGTITDVDGHFRLTDISATTILQFSFIGYLSQEEHVGLKDVINIILEEETSALDEVVVVGYGVQKKVNLSGSISQITSQELKDRPVANATQILQGAIPNVDIKFSSGQPGQGGSINIRGLASVNGGAPLVLIDGVPGDINRINPRDIESISVLKDAAASAIYGARGAFGVVLVTTKSAKSGKTSLSYGAFVGQSSPTVKTNFMTNGYESVMLNDEAFRRTTGNTYTRYSEEDYKELEARRFDRVEHPDRPWTVIKNVNGKDIYNYYGNHDWWNTMFTKTQPSQSHNINLSGGTEKFNFILSGNYFSKDGVMKVNTDNFSSYVFRVKLNAQLYPFLKVSNNTQYYDKSYNYPGLEGGSNPNFVYVTVHALPAYAPLNPDGTATYNTLKNNYSIGDGLFAMLFDGGTKGVKKAHEFTSTTGVQLDLFKQLKINADYTYSLYIADDWYRSTSSNYSIQPSVLQEVPNFNTDQLKKTMWFDPLHVFNLYANFRQELDKQTLSATAGINYEHKMHSQLFASRKNLISKQLNDLNLGTGDMEVRGGAYEYTLFGSFFRLNYDYLQRYLLEVNGRYDGTSKYKRGKRYGLFPSFSAAWRVSEEPFFKNATGVINNLKLRASYGTLGNQLSVDRNVSADYYPYISTMGMGLSNWLIDGQKTQHVSAPSYVIDNLTWEKATTSNIGVDVNMLSNRLTVTFDTYIRKTTEMLIPGKTLPSVFGTAPPKQNAGDLKTKGFEVFVSWKDQIQVLGKPLSYGVTASLGDATSVITKFDNPKNLLSNHYVGKQWGEIWGYAVDGFFASNEEATNYPIDQTLVNTQIRRSPGEWGRLRAGDLKYLDLNGDGKVTPGKNTVDDPGDRTIIGNSEPRYNYGFNLSASWNGFDASIFWQGIGKRNWYPANNADKFWGPYSRPYYSFLPENFNDLIWTEENPNAYFPLLRGYTALSGGGSLNNPNNKYIQNIGYLRLKNIVLGYTLPSSLTKKGYIENVRFYISGENLLTFTPFKTKYIDPEQPVADRNGRTYPLSKTLSFGLDITF